MPKKNDIEEKILALIKEMGIIGYRGISRRLGIPYSTVRYVVKKLDEEGKIILIDTDGATVPADPSIFKPEFLKRKFRKKIERIMELAKMYGIVGGMGDG